jgi:hypothetical protein
MEADEQIGMDDLMPNDSSFFQPTLPEDYAKAINAEKAMVRPPGRCLTTSPTGLNRPLP